METLPTTVRLGQNTVPGKWTVERKRDAKRGLKFEMVDEEESAWKFLYALT